MKEVDFVVDVKEIKRIPVVSFALIVAIVSAITLLIINIIMAALGTSMMASTYIMPMMSSYNHMFTGNMFTFYSIMVMPIIVFICVFLITTLAAIIYNLFAPKIGGIKMELE